MKNEDTDSEKGKYRQNSVMSFVHDAVFSLFFNRPLTGVFFLI